MSKKNPTIQTTKLGNKVQKGKGKKPEKKTEAEEHVLNAGEEPVGHKETIRFFFGLCFRNAGASGAAEAFRFCRAHGQVPLPGRHGFVRAA